MNRKLKNKELICDGKHPELDWYIDIENFLVNTGALVNNISKVKPNNIMYLRGSEITQYKQIE